jgi:hypothetical protein
VTHASACLSDEALAALAAGGLGADVSAGLHDHVDDCPRCAALLLAAVRAGAAPAPADVASASAATLTGVPAAPFDADRAAASPSRGAVAWAADVARAPAAGAPRLGLAAAVPPGTTLGRFEVRQVLGSGNMGTVFSGWDPQLRRAVAIKVLRAGRTDAQHARRLLREARAMAQVRHPSVVTVFEVGEDNDVIFIAMEQIGGRTLRAAMADRPSAPVVEAWLQQIAGGLAAVHRAGLVHRDVKPDNIFVEAGPGVPRVVIGDFGLAVGDDSATSALRRSSAAIGTRGAGTPAYMAPEQLEAQPASARTDVFAFGVTAWELLTGSRPFPGKTAAAIHEAICRGPKDKLAAPGLRPRTARLIERCVRVLPDERPASMIEVATELASATPTRRRWVWPALAAVAAVAVAVPVVLTVTARPAPAPDLLACDPAAAPVWDRRGSAWEAAAAGARSPHVRAAIAANMTSRAATWRALAAPACSANVLTQQAWVGCRARSERVEEALLEAALTNPGAADERLVALVTTLEPPSDCSGRDAGELAVQLAGLPMAGRDAIADGLGELTRARVARALDDDAGRDRALAAAEARARVVAPSMLDGELALASAELRTSGGSATPAALVDVVAAAERSGRSSLVVRARLALATALLQRGAPAREVDAALTATDWAITRVGDPPGARARWHRLSAMQAFAHGDRPTALTQLRAAVRVAGADPLLRQQRLADAAMLASQASDLGAARQLYEELVSDPDLRALIDDAELGALEISLAQVDYGLGDMAAAQQVVTRALARLRDEPWTARARVMGELVAATLALVRGEAQAGRDGLRRALEVARVQLAPTHEIVAEAHVRLARAELMLGDQAAALAAARVGAGMYDELQGHGSPGAIAAHATLASVECAVAPDDACVAAWLDVVTTADKTYGVASVDAAQLHVGHARALRARGRTDEAIATLRPAVPALQAGTIDPRTVAGAEFELAQLLEPSERVEAMALATSAQQRLADVDAELAAEVGAWLAAHRAPKLGKPPSR